MHLEISHLTRYEYDRDVSLQSHLMYLRPRDTPLLQVSRFAIDCAPAAQLRWMRDDFDNICATAEFSSLARTLEIRAFSSVITSDSPPFDFQVRDYARMFPFVYEPLHQFNLTIYLQGPDAATQNALRSWLDRRFPARPSETVAWLFALNQAIHFGLTYQRRDEAGIQSALTTLSLGSGSCRDYAALLVECARTLGVAARFVSGYLFDAALSPNGLGDMHAWVEVFVPGAGWRGLDPTRGLFCDNTYIPVAHAVVAESVNPIQGSYSSPASTGVELSVEVRIRRR